MKLPFQGLRGMPNIIGAIDTTHVQIKHPSVPNTEIYYNRRWQLTENMQVVVFFCDTASKTVLLFGNSLMGFFDVFYGMSDDSDFLWKDLSSHAGIGPTHI